MAESLRSCKIIAEELISFEAEVAAAFERKEIRGPVHLVGGNERQLIDIFQWIQPQDWVLSTWRSHYHALLKGVPRETVMAEIMAGRSMSLHFQKYKFLTSAIVGSVCSIACGLAAAGERVWCFVGDMAATTGQFHEAAEYAKGHNLPVTFIVEDNGLATNTPTAETWGKAVETHVMRYGYTRTLPHCGVGKYVQF